MSRAEPDSAAGGQRPSGADVRQAAGTASLRVIFSGRRGRLLAALLFAEFGGAMQTIAYSTVLPLASRALHGGALYGATLAAGTFSMILMLALGPGPLARLEPAWMLLAGTAVYVAGAVLAATAPYMAVVLAGFIVRGVASGLLAGFGLSAIGGLFEDAIRPRVLGMFAVVWLLPSLAGPTLNAVVTVEIGWRWALAWPAALVLAGRLLIGRDTAMIPWKSTMRRRLDVRKGAVLLAALVLAASAPAVGGTGGVLALGLGLAASIAAAVQILRAQVGPEVRRRRTAIVFSGLCLAYFGGSSVISLAVVDGLRSGVVASGVAVGAGLVGWSVTGLRPPRFDSWLGDASVVGLLLMAAGLVLVFLSQAVPFGRTTALVILVAGWALAGVGMGLCYPRVSAEIMNNLATERVARVATAVAFAETAGSAIGSLLAGTTFSLALSAGIAPHRSIGWGYLMLAAVALVTLAIYVSRREEPAVRREPEPHPAEESGVE